MTYGLIGRRQQMDTDDGSANGPFIRAKSDWSTAAPRAAESLVTALGEIDHRLGFRWRRPVRFSRE